MLIKVPLFAGLLVLVLSVSLGKDLDSIPGPVKAAVEASDLCYHWAEEVGDQTAERNKQIAEGVARDCPEARRKVIEARKQFPSNQYLSLAILKLNDIGYFELTNEERTKTCERGAPLMKNGFLASIRQDFYFQALCPQQSAGTAK